MGDAMVKNPPANAGDMVQSLDQEDSLILAWKISWIEEPGGLQSMGFQKVGHK